MSRFSAKKSNNEDYHSEFKKRRGTTGVLITNLGTPNAPTTAALRSYLREFLSDPRVVEIPRLLWFCILYCFILPLRPKKSAALYKSVWTEEGSPLLAISRAQEQKLQHKLGDKAVVKLGMRYGTPSIAEKLREFQQQGITRIIVLPLYPQYGGPTTGSTFDGVTKEINRWRYVPEFHFINHYYRTEAYIESLTNSIAEALNPEALPEKLILSYHGMPRLFLKNGDPYYCHSMKTTSLLKEKLLGMFNFSDDQIITTFQSRFGKAEWLKPYTDVTLESLAKSGVKNIAIACPAFSVDCLETLEEIAVENKDIFIEAGGETYQYIPALNDRDDHIGAMAELINPYL